MGGLARKASYIKSQKGSVDGVLIVDGGDMLTPPPGMLRDVTTPAQITARAEILAKLQVQIGLAAAAVGERDLALGLKELRRIAKASGLKLLAANLVDQAGKPAFEPGFVTEVAGVKIGLLGVTDVPEGQAAPLRDAGIKALPAAEAASKEAERLRAKGATLVVALAHVGFAGARDLLTKAPGIDLAVVGHTSNVVVNPVHAGNGYFAEAQRQGKQLGEFLLHIIPGQKGIVDGGRRRGYLEQMGRQQRDYERFAAMARNEKIATRREMYLVRLRGLRDGILESCKAAKEPDPVGGNWFEHQLVAMNRAVPVDPEIGDAVRKYKESAPKAVPGVHPVRPGTPAPPPGVRLPPGIKAPPGVRALPRRAPPVPPVPPPPPPVK